MNTETLGNNEGLPKLDQKINLEASQTPAEFLERPDTKNFAHLEGEELKDFLYTEADRNKYKSETNPDAKTLLVLESMRQLPSSDPKTDEIFDGAIELLKQKIAQ